MTGARRPALEARGLCKRFGDRGEGAPALDGVDLTVEAGEFLAVVGRSGCGKSTLLSLLAGLETPTAGEVLADGRPVEGPDADRAMMFQSYALLPWKTVWGNVEFGLRHGPAGRGMSAEERAERVRAVIDRVGLRGDERKFPHQLSGGMNQRCALARVLAIRPRVLLMDEPFAAVDAQTRRGLQSELLRVWEEGVPQARMTCVLVTHALDEAVFLADRVLVMHGPPGTTGPSLAIDLPRPRSDAVRTSPRLAQLSESIWRILYPEDAPA